MGVLYPEDLVHLLVTLALAILVTTLLLVLASSLRRRYVEYWTVGWSVQAVYVALLVAMTLGWTQFAGVWHALGAIAALAFGVTLVLGCRDYMGRPPLAAWWLIPFVLVAVGMVVATFILGDRLAGIVRPERASQLALVLVETVIHAAATILSLAYLSGLVQGSHQPRGRMGQRLFAIALLVSLLFEGHQLLLFAWSWRRPELLGYLVTSSRFELVIELLTAFGVIILALDSVREELEAMNRDLSAATGRLERLAHRDAMTEALNRHAFYTLLEEKRPAVGEVAGGAVVLLDVDHLKPINDALGHAAGDAAIRGVSKAIRSLIRPDDLLFRWGGDEFLVLLPNVTVDDAHERFSRLNGLLAETSLPGATKPWCLQVSYGIADFADLIDLEKAITLADKRMFMSKDAKRRQTGGK